MYLLSAFLVLALFSNASLPAFAEKEPQRTKKDTSGTVLTDAAETETPLYVEQATYSDYYDTYIGENRPEQEILVQGSAYTSMDAGSEPDGVSVGSYGSDYNQENRDNIL